MSNLCKDIKDKCRTDNISDQQADQGASCADSGTGTDSADPDGIEDLISSDDNIVTREKSSSTGSITNVTGDNNNVKGDTFVNIEFSPSFTYSGGLKASQAPGIPPVKRE